MKEIDVYLHLQLLWRGTSMKIHWPRARAEAVLMEFAAGREEMRRNSLLPSVTPSHYLLAFASLATLVFFVWKI